MSQEVNVIEVESSKLLNTFITLPFKLYKDDPNWVAPLLIERKEFFNKKKNPFYRGAKTKLFIAMRENEPVGRIATCINYNHNVFHSEHVGFFGFFDCIDDYDVAAKLLKVAMITLKSEGMEKMRGPANFSTNHEVGFLVDGFDSPPVIMNPYNPPYIPKLAEKFGLKKVMDLYAFMMTDELPLSDRILKVVERIKERNKVTIRPLDLSHFDEELKKINYIYNNAWSDNWGFVPMPEEEFYHMGKDLKQIVDPDLVLIAEIDGEPVGFSMALPDMNIVLKKLNGRLFPFGMLKLLWHMKIRRKIDGVRVMTMGVVHKYQKRGIDNVFYVETFNRGTAKGYKWAELSWILETNELMCRAAESLGAKLYKKYRMVEMPL
ncbi:MAG: N-acetyltransferase [candidate division Zixibacteria bacterium HGW-Zixibacteria-1]|nr:MAG: N-acetyltransferase [candidate division Zixibacteria bacterium HGW-Zixibacteria-1]